MHLTIETPTLDGIAYTLERIADELHRIADARERIANTLDKLDPSADISEDSGAENKPCSKHTNKETTKEANEETAEKHEFISLEDFRAGIVKYARSHEDGKSTVKNVLAEHDAARVSEVKEEDRASVLEKLGV